MRHAVGLRPGLERHLHPRHPQRPRPLALGGDLHRRRRPQHHVGAALAPHPEPLLLAVVGVVVQEVAAERRRAAERLPRPRRADVDRQVVDQRQLERQPPEEAGLGVLAGIERRVERVVQQRRDEERAQRRGCHRRPRRRQRRHQEQEHRVDAEEVAVADRPAAARVGERHVEHQEHGRADAAGQHQPAPRRPLPPREQEQHHRRQARQEVGGEAGVAAERGSTPGCGGTRRRRRRGWPAPRSARCWWRGRCRSCRRCDRRSGTGTRAIAAAVERLAIAALVVPLAGDGDVGAEEPEHDRGEDQRRRSRPRRHCRRSANSASTGSISSTCVGLEKVARPSQTRGHEIGARPDQPRRSRRARGRRPAAPLPCRARRSSRGSPGPG